jgi:hypothetical protein
VLELAFALLEVTPEVVSIMLAGRLPSRSIPKRSPVREAACEFIRGTAYGWGREELARWLVCQYSPCLVVDATVHPDAGVGLRERVAATLSTASYRLEDERLEQLILDARSSVLNLLSDLAWESHRIVLSRTMIAAGAVIKQRDGKGGFWWMPVGRKRMRLAERVSSLFVADALNAPFDYRSVTLCRECGELGFSVPIVHEGSCNRLRRVA